MIAFIDDHREVHGVEPICKVHLAGQDDDIEPLALRHSFSFVRSAP